MSTALASLREDAIGTMWVIAAIVVASLGVCLGIWIYGRRWLDRHGSETAREPWTLDDLRRLREEGQLSEQEYQAMRAAMIASYRGKSPLPEAKPAKADNDP